MADDDGSTDDASTGVICYGQHIALTCKPRGGGRGRESNTVAFAYSVGFSNVSIQTAVAEVTETGLRVPGSFRNCVFQVLPVQQQAPLTEGATHEARPVRFGEVVQLRHVASSKFVVTRPTQLSASSSECMMLELDAHADEHSHFELQSRFKHRSDGDMAQFSDQLMFYSLSVRRYISSQISEFSDTCEVNLSAHICAWAPQLYSSVSAAQNLCSGDIVRLFHFDCESYLVLSQTSVSAPASVVLQSSSKASSASISGTQTEHVDTNSYWELEAEDVTDGSPVAFGRPYRFRHVNHGKYLSIVQPAAVEITAPANGGRSTRALREEDMLATVDEEVDTDSDSDHESSMPSIPRPSLSKPRPKNVPTRLVRRVVTFRVDRSEASLVDDGSMVATLVSDPSPTTLFTILPADTLPQGSVVRRGAAIRLVHVASGRWLHGSRATVKTPLGTLNQAAMQDLPGSSQQRMNANTGPGKVLTYAVLAVAATQDQDVFMMSAADRSDMNDTMVLLGALPCLQQYVQAFRSLGGPRNRRASTSNSAQAPRGSDASEDGLPIPASILQEAHRVLEDLSAFITGCDDGDDPAGQPIESRQHLLSEHLAADLLVAMLTVPFDDWQGPLTMKHMPPAIRSVCQLCYRVLMLMFRGNPQNEVLASKHTHVFVKQIGYELGAELALTSLLTDNLMLIEQLPRVHVQAFVTLLRTKGRVPLYLNFLTALCSFRGAGVAVKQELLCDILFGNNDGAYSKGDSARLGITSLHEAGADIIIPVRSEEQQLMVCMEPDRWVTFAEFYGHRSPLREYMTASLKLFTEMCVGRNYVCIREISAMFSREALGTCMWDSSLDFPVRAALCRLFLVLYVDVRPHVRVAVAERTRLWNKVPARQSVLTAIRATSFNEQWLGELSNRILSHLTSSNIGQLTTERVTAAEAEFILALLQLTKRMLQFGLFTLSNASSEDSGDVRQQLSTLCGSLLKLLDCRRLLGTRRTSPSDPFGRSRSVVAGGNSTRARSMMSPPSERGKSISHGASRIAQVHPVAGSPSASDMSVSSKTQSLQQVGGGTDSSAVLDNRSLPTASTGVAAFQSFRIMSKRAGAGAGTGAFGKSSSKLVKAPSLRMKPLAAPIAQAIVEEPDGVSESKEFLADTAIVPQSSEPQDLISITEQHKALIEDCRVVICGIFEFVAMLRADFLLAQLLGVFYENFDTFVGEEAARDLSAAGWDLSLGFPQPAAGGAGRRSFIRRSPAESTDVVKETLQLHHECPWDLQKLCGEDMDEVLIHLLKFAHNGLTSAALNLLLDYFCSQVTVNRLLSEVQLLVSPSTVAAYGMVRLVHPKLQMLVETAETWMGMDSEDDQTSCQQVRTILEQLSDIMWIVSVDDATAAELRSNNLEGESLGAAFDSASGLAGQQVDVNASLECILAISNDGQIAVEYVRVDPERQQLLYNMGVPSLVISLLQQGSAMLTNRQNRDIDLSLFMEELLHTFAHCYRFLLTFVAESDRNARVLAGHVDLFTQLVSQGVWSAKLLGAIFKDNVNLCKEVREVYVRRLVDNVAAFGQIPGLLEPLISMINVAGQSMDHNAHAILGTLMDKRTTAVPMLHTTPDELNRLAADPATMRALMIQEANNDLRVFQPQRHTRRLGAVLSGVGFNSRGGPADSLDAPSPGGGDRDSSDSVLTAFIGQLEAQPLLYYTKMLQLFGELAACSSAIVVGAVRSMFPLWSTMQALTKSTPAPVATQLVRLIDALWLTPHPAQSGIANPPPLEPAEVSGLSDRMLEMLDSLPSRLTGNGTQLDVGVNFTQSERKIAINLLKESPQKADEDTVLHVASARLQTFTALVPAAEHFILKVLDSRAVDVAYRMVVMLHTWGVEEGQSGNWRSTEADAVLESCAAANRVLRAPWWVASTAAEVAKVSQQLMDLETACRSNSKRKSEALRSPALGSTGRRNSSIEELRTPSNGPPGVLVAPSPSNSGRRRASMFQAESASALVLAENVEAAFRRFVQAVSAPPADDNHNDQMQALEATEPDSQFVEFAGAIVRGGTEISGQVTFDDRIKRCIQFARDATDLDTMSVDLVLRTLRIIVATGNTSADQAKLQNMLADKGAVQFLHEQLQRGVVDTARFDSLLATCIMMLQGGNVQVQGRLTDLWTASSTPLHHMNAILQECIQNIREESTSSSHAGGVGLQENAAPFSPIPQSVTLILRLLQVMCEGHNLRAQNFLREQPESKRSVNLVATTSQLLYVLQHQPRQETLPVAIQALNTLIEMVQGPCSANQLELVNRKIVETVGTLLTITDILSAEDTGLGKVLQHRCSLMLTSLFEGRVDKLVHSRVASVLSTSIDGMKRSMLRVYEDFQRLHHGMYVPEAFMQQFEEGAAELQQLSAKELTERAVLETGFGIYVLFRNLLDYDASLGMLIQAPPLSEEEGAGTASDDEEDEDVASVRTMDHPKHLYHAALRFFEQHTRSVEIVREGALEKFYFPEPPLCRHLTKQTQEAVIWSIDRSGPAKKIQALFELHRECIDEMRHQQWLHKFSRSELERFSPGTASWRSVCFSITVVINFLVLICYERDPENLDDGFGSCDSTLFGRETDIAWGTAIFVLGLCQIFFGGAIALYNLVNFAPLIARKAMKQQLALTSGKAFNKPVKSQQAERHSYDALLWTSLGNGGIAKPKKRVPITKHISAAWTWFNIVLSAFGSLSTSPLMFWVVFLLFACLGAFVHPYFSALCLLELVSRFEELRLVLRSITRPAKTLVLTAILFVVFEYYFSILGFAFLVNNYKECNKWDSEDCVNQCTTLFSCFITTFDQGFKNNGGVGAYLGPNLHRQDRVDTLWGLRFLYDNMFNIILLTIMLNIVFGLIIDTFAELRTQKKEKEDDMTGRCFICNIDRAEFDRKGRGFNNHIREDHCMWYYIYLIVHLLHKPRTELTGVEDYLYRMVMDANVGFFPMHRALVLGDHSQSASSADE